jgi:hypothetical protein
MPEMERETVIEPATGAARLDAKRGEVVHLPPSRKGRDHARDET